MKSKFITSSQILILSLFINSAILGQNPFDCIDAIYPCDNSTLEIDYEMVEGSVTEDVGDICTISQINQFFFDQNTIWVKYQFLTGGDFLFTITSPLTENDIDFVVFKSESKSCEDLIAVRCMFTGENANSPTDPACIGPTGLSSNSIDNFEGPGCFNGDDNFLAPLEVNAGDVYYLAVTAFSFVNEYSIEHAGTAEISCNSVGLSELNNKEVNLFPNPTFDQLHIDVRQNDSQEYVVEVYNVMGKLMIRQKFIDQIDLNTTDLSRGMYSVKIYNDNDQLYTKNFIKSE